MLDGIFTLLSDVLMQNWYAALAGAAAWGLLSVILSPCHLGSIPLIVAFINRQGKISYRKAFLISLVFSLGMLFSISAIGVATGLAGRMIGDIGFAGRIGVAVIFFVTGLHFLDLLPFPDITGFSGERFKNKGILSGFLLGVLFGLALGPCTFAFMAPVLAIVFSSSAQQFSFSVLLVTAFAAGHCLVFVFFGTFSELAQRFLNWDGTSGGTAVAKKAIGVILILSGAYLIYSSL